MKLLYLSISYRATNLDSPAMLTEIPLAMPPATLKLTAGKADQMSAPTGLDDFCIVSVFPVVPFAGVPKIFV